MQRTFRLVVHKNEALEYPFFATLFTKVKYEEVICLKRNSNIGRPTLDRLPLYFHVIRKMRNEGVATISSIELAYRTGTTAEIVRKDFAMLGYFGKRGVGYPVDKLLVHIGKTLGHQESWNAVIVGLGYSFANYYCDFFPESFHLVGVFDVECERFGRQVPDLKTEIYPFDHLEAMSVITPIHTGVIAVKAGYAQEVANKLVEIGVVGICNLSPINVWAPPEVTLINNNLSASLSILSYHLLRTKAHASMA
jgi:redox-sensing transcriptional repressor